MGEGTLIGVGVYVIPCINIGSWCTIDAGAAVTKNIKDNMKEVGVSAKPLKSEGFSLMGGRKPSKSMYLAAGKEISHAA